MGSSLVWFLVLLVRITVGISSVNSSRVSFPVECSFRLAKSGDKVEVGDEEKMDLETFALG